MKSLILPEVRRNVLLVTGTLPVTGRFALLLSTKHASQEHIRTDHGMRRLNPGNDFRCLTAFEHTS